jgi:glycosyltransferase involved in cell wall biosynthesis
LPSALCQRIGLAPDQPYILHVGGNQWYKNRPGVVRIFRELAAMEPFTNARLVMAGKPFPPDLRALVDRTGLADRILSVTGTSNEELEALYSNAIALLFPSLEEGFGWPIAEAQACGCPVITTRRNPMAEVAGDAAIYIDPEDPGGPAAVAHTIVAGMGRNLEHREALRSAGFRNVTRFEEGRIASEYCEFYATVLEGRNKS